MRKAINYRSFLLLDAYKKATSLLLINQTKFFCQSNSIFNVININDISKKVHNLQLTNFEVDVKIGRKKFIKDDIIRENFLEEWFKNLSSILKVDPSYLIDWSDSQSSIVMPIFEKFDHKWPLIVLSYFASFTQKYPGLLDNAMNLIDYIKKNKLSRNEIILKIMTLTILFNQGDQTHIEKVMMMYANLKEQLIILDENLYLMLIKIISKTSQWRDCFNYLEMIKLTSTLHSTSITPVLIACSRHNDFENKQKLLNVLADNLLMPTDDYFLYMVKHDADTLFKELRNFKWIINENISDVIKESHEKYTVVDTIIRNGRCEVCNHKLPNSEEISEEDFNILKNKFVNKVFFKKSNVFINSTPLEIDKFYKFCLKNSKFDVVIDALNIRGNAYKGSTKQEKNNNLLQVIKYFEDRDFKILVLSRYHLQKIKTASALWFFTDNISADDTFGLFAALNSKSRGALYVSNDLLRDHSCLFEPRLANIFKIWQQGHQVMYKGLDKKGQPCFVWPAKHETRCHISDGNIHVPYESHELAIKFQFADKWLCLRRKQETISANDESS